MGLLENSGEQSLFWSLQKERSCQYLDFGPHETRSGLLTSRTVKKSKFVVICYGSGVSYCRGVCLTGLGKGFSH